MRSARGASPPACSLGCQARCRRCAAKYTACWPVPLPTSRTRWPAANSVLRTSRIGPLLRSQAADSVSTARVCDTAPRQAIDVLLKRRSARALTEPAPDEGALQLIFSSAVRAPDHGRLRPWRFVVVRGGARERLRELV